jgi:hypothetical protein
VHPLCVRLHGAFQDTHSLYLLQEFVPGERRQIKRPQLLKCYCGAAKAPRQSLYVSPLLSGCTLLDAAAAGGELLARLSDEGALRDGDARWCTACVVAALASLHAQGTVYRVRAPERCAARRAAALQCSVQRCGPPAKS